MSRITPAFSCKNLLSKTLLPSIVVMSFSVVGCQNIPALSAKTPAAYAMNTGIMQTHSNYENTRYLTIADTNYPVSETSARVVVDDAQDSQELVADIFDGKGKVAVPGYKVMLMNRTSSIAAEGRTLNDGKVIDNRMIHRGSKSLVGIPVVNGQAQLDQAQLLDFDIIYDDPSKNLLEEDVVKPRGSKLTKSDTTITNKKVTVRSLTLPNIASGESAGGGVDFEASAVIDGKVVTTGANSAFNIFYTTTTDKARGF